MRPRLICEVCVRTLILLFQYKSFKLDGYDEPPRDEANREFGYFTVDHSESFDPYHRRRSIPVRTKGKPSDVGTSLSLLITF